MRHSLVASLLSGSVLLFATNAIAQIGLGPDIEPAPVADVEPQTQEASDQLESAGEAPSPDAIADQLNGSQQLQQSFTLKRTINGEVVATEKRTLTYDRNTPYRETEAGKTSVEALKEAFDGELLTRTEAFEEAKLDFTVADANRDDLMTEDEFTSLVKSWRETGAHGFKETQAETARQRQYDAFLAELDPTIADRRFESFAAKRFRFLAGASETVSRADYLREYLLDFDSMDANKDSRLEGDELLKFRGLNRGESLEM